MQLLQISFHVQEELHSLHASQVVPTAVDHQHLWSTSAPLQALVEEGQHAAPAQPSPAKPLDMCGNSKVGLEGVVSSTSDVAVSKDPDCAAC